LVEEVVEALRKKGGVITHFTLSDEYCGGRTLMLHGLDSRETHDAFNAVYKEHLDEGKYPNVRALGEGPFIHLYSPLFVSNLRELMAKLNVLEKVQEKK